VAWPDQSPQVASEVSAAYQGEKSPEQAMSDLESSLGSIESDLAE